MNEIMASTGGRAPPGQNTLMPCAGFRSPAAVPGSPALAPSSAPVHRSLGQAVSLDRARPVAPTCATSRPCSRSSMQSNSSLPIATRDRLHAPAPCAPRVPGLQEKIDLMSSSSWLHLLKLWSLRQTRSGSSDPVTHVLAARVETCSDDNPDPNAMAPQVVV